MCVLCCRRADRRLRLVAVATDDSVDEETKIDSKILSESLLSDSAPADTQHSAKPNLYEPEPRAPARVKVTRERNQKKIETQEPVDHPYCAMDGTDTSEYLQPVSVCPDGGYLTMGPPPNYDSCVDEDPPVSYANTENDEPTIDTACEPDCGMMGYDVPPPMHLYSEIPGNEDEVDNEGNHIYESLDQVTQQ